MTTEARPDSTEPNFSSWGNSEPEMQGGRIQMMGRAASFGEGGWLFADEMSGNWYPSTRRDQLIILTTLVTQGFLESDLSNPNILRATEDGINWLTAQTSALPPEVL